MEAVAKNHPATDAEALRIHHLHERMRHESYRRVIELIAAKGPLRTGLDLDAATDILLTLIGDDIYPAFRRDRRWAHERCVEYLCSAVPELLLAQP
jgi:hypothetical protein